MGRTKNKKIKVKKMNNAKKGENQKSHSNGCKKSVCVNNSAKEKVKRLNYSPDKIQHALTAIENTKISLRKAAQAYGVPIATLSRKKNNINQVKKKSGPETVLSSSEEQEIVNWILYRAEHGVSVTKTELLDSVQHYVKYLCKKTPFVNNRPSRHWYEGFRKRHPNLSIRKPQHLSISRACVTREELQNWFENQNAYLKKNNLFDITPDRVFNGGECSILLSPDSERVFSEKGSHSVRKMVGGDKECCTVLFMYSASGIRAPPMIMHALKEKVSKKIVENTPKSWGLGISETGGMTAETFFEYITNVFYPWLVANTVQFPIIMYMDNHSSHLSIPLVIFCRNKGIELIELPPNSTHIMQSFDITYFHPFKETWKKGISKWKNQQNVVHLKRKDFGQVLKFTLDNMTNERDIIISGFRGSGLYPFNPHAVDYDVLKSKKKTKETINNQEQQQQPVNITEYQKDQAQIFDKKLPPELLLQFKNSLASGSWLGEIEMKGLFEYWLQINGLSTGIML